MREKRKLQLLACREQLGYKGQQSTQASHPSVPHSPTAASTTSQTSSTPVVPCQNPPSCFRAATAGWPALPKQKHASLCNTPTSCAEQAASNRRPPAEKAR